MKGDRTIVIDFDGTIAEHRFPNIGTIMPEAVEVINKLSHSRWKCIISSCRNNPYLYHYPEERDNNLELVKDFLINSGLKRFSIDDGRIGKPITKWQIDDKGIFFKGCWKMLIENFFSQEKKFFNSLMKTTTVSIGIEGCIFDDNNKLIKGASESLNYLVALGVRVVLTTTQTNRLLYDSERERNKKLNNIKRKLKDLGVPYHWLDDGTLGKPIADFYIEANMIVFKGSWQQVLKDLKAQTNQKNDIKGLL
jgi:hypothetical protein